MNIALIGLGGMGQVVRRIALERGHNVPVVADTENEEATHAELSAEALNGVDMVIDFARADGVLERIQTCNDAGVSMVMGTTGWYDNLDQVRNVLSGDNIGFLWSSNFSIGVNLYFQIVQRAAELMNDFDEYDVWGHEIHHFRKADSPSGTAKTLGKILLDNIERKTVVVEEKLDRKREPNEIHFSSLRGGAVNFRHEIGFDSEADTIQITHSARSRDGYALGAVKAAEWLYGRKGYFEMSDFLNF
ncbi:MAG: 4-hydroxy-tetrahydrodipicolinate reductase [Patescibacteria group bacterium]